MPTIYLMRHAESTMQVSPVALVGGRQNHIPLTEHGREQAAKARDYLLRHDIRPTVIYSSPAVRALDTTKIVLDTDDGQIRIDDRFQELTHGQAEGKPREQIYTPEAIHQLSVIGMDFKFPGGESINEVADRVLEGLNDISAQARPDDVLFVGTHAVAIKATIARLCGYDQQWIYTAISHNVCLTRLTYTDGQLVLDHEFLLVDTL